MCGFAGRYKALGLPKDPKWLETADYLLAHRGPDGKGRFSDKSCELMHRRLAIIDPLPRSNQPMFNHREDICIVFNGEIYNHLELKSGLEKKGYQFKTKSDTEVLIYLYEEYGQEISNHIRGMFAFAIYDKRKNEIILCRDRFGIKPLYYHYSDYGLIFASEIKAITTSKFVDPKMDHQACYDYLSLGYVPEPLTGFMAIKSLPKGHMAIANAAGFKLHEYYNLNSISVPADNDKNILDRVDCLIDSAVQEQSISDVPMGALLSGGIDSSLITSAYSRWAQKPLRTFNVGFPERAYDESQLAYSVADQYKTNHTQLRFEKKSINSDTVLRLFHHFDQPFADTSFFAVYLVSKLIKEQGITCVLSGDGGDEVFGGYDSTIRLNIFLMMMQMPDLFLKIFAKTGDQIGHFHRNIGRRLTKASKISMQAKLNPAILLSSQLNWLNEDQKKELINHTQDRQFQSIERYYQLLECFKNDDIEHYSRFITLNRFNLSLPGDMLKKVDMMSMLSGLEVRVPLLSEALVKAGIQLSHRLRTNGLKGKWLLRKVAKRHLPKKVVNHKKHGFIVPMDILADSSVKELCMDYLTAGDSKLMTFINKDVLKQWCQLFKNNRSEYSVSRESVYQRVFICLSLEIWMRNNRLNW